MEILFLGLGSGTSFSVLRKLKYPYVFVSFTTRNVGNIKNLISRIKPKIVFIDSGGFYSAFKGHTYPLKDYVRFVSSLAMRFPRVEVWFATRDYPCEPELLKKHNYTVVGQIEKTIRDTLMIIRLLKNKPSNLTLIPIRQGWAIKDYELCIEKMYENEIIDHYEIIGIGSTCRRYKDYEVAKIIRRIYNLIPGKKFHAFGLKRSAWGLVSTYLFSTDTLAYSLSARYYALKENIPLFNAYLHIVKEYISTLIM